MSNPKLLRGRASQQGAYYALTMVTHELQSAFSDPGLAHIVIAEIDNCVRSGLATSIAWAVMPDHLHWLIESRDDSLSRCVQAMKSRSARTINRTRGANGQFGSQASTIISCAKTKISSRKPATSLQIRCAVAWCNASTTTHSGGVDGSNAKPICSAELARLAGIGD